MSNAMKPELKPCPMCGLVDFVDSRETIGHWEHQSNGCALDGIAIFIAEEWNKRPTEASDRAKIAVLETTQEELVKALEGVEARLFALGQPSPICQLHREGLSRIVDFIRASLKRAKQAAEQGKGESNG